MPIRGVLFDVDETLFAYEDSERTGLFAHLKDDGLLDGFATFADALALWREIMEAEYARFTAGELTFPGQQLARTRRFLAAVGREPGDGASDAEARAWFAGYEAHRNAAWTAFDDAEPTLKALAATHRLGVVSNSAAEHQRRKLVAIGLIGYFVEPIVCSDQHGAPKPAASIFHAGCATLGLPPGEVAYVGDVYLTDAIGARDAGLRAVWLNRSGGAARPVASAAVNAGVDDGVAVISSLTELPDLLARL